MSAETVAAAEQAVLGSMMLSPKACAKVIDLLRGPDFRAMKHQVTFEAVVRLAAAGKPTDVIATVDELLRAGELPQAGGPEYVHALTSSVATPENVGYYAGIVSEESTRRTLIAAAERLAQDAHTDPGVALAAALQTLTDVRDHSGGDTHVRWLADLLNVPEAEDTYDWVIPGLLERQDRLMFSAGEGVGKSTLLRQIAILAGAGIHPFDFTHIPPIRVLVVDAENSDRQWRRATRRMTDLALQRGSRDPRGNVAVHTVSVMDLTKAADLGKVHKWIDESAPDLVVLGPLYRLVGGNPIDKESEAAPVLAALESIRSRNVAMVIEVHAGHDRDRKTGERNLRPRGSSSLLGWPEFGLGLREDKNGKGSYSIVRWRGDRDRRDWPAHLRRGQEWPWEKTYSF